MTNTEMRRQERLWKKKEKLQLAAIQVRNNKIAQANHDLKYKIRFLDEYVRLFGIEDEQIQFDSGGCCFQ